MFVFLCQIYTTFDSNWLSQNDEWGLFIYVQWKKRKYFIVPLFFFFTTESTVHNSLLFWGLRLSLRLTSVVLGCSVNEGSCRLPSPTTMPPPTMLLPREAQTSSRCLCHPWLCLDSNSGRVTQAQPPSLVLPPTCSPCFCPWPPSRLASGQPENPFIISCHVSTQNHWKVS